MNFKCQHLRADGICSSVHEAHNTADSLVGGVYYVSVPPNSGHLQVEIWGFNLFSHICCPSPCNTKKLSLLSIHTPYLQLFDTRGLHPLGVNKGAFFFESPERVTCFHPPMHSCYNREKMICPFALITSHKKNTPMPRTTLHHAPTHSFVGKVRTER